MNILQVITRSEAGGGQTVVASLASDLLGLGHTVSIVAGPEGGGEAWSSLDPRIGTHVVDGLVRAFKPLHELRAIRNLSALFRDLAPDIIHLHTSKAGALGRIAGGTHASRIVYTMHGFDQLRVSNRSFLFVDKALRNRCGAIVAVSGHDRNLMRAEGYDPFLVPNGCADASRGELPANGITEGLSRLRNHGLPIVLMIARNAAPKRIDLARATAVLLDGIASVAWIGGMAEAGDPANFHALGVSVGTSVHLRQADLFLLLSDHEGLSVSLLEALSMGKPAVVSAIDGCLEVLGLESAGRSRVGVAVPNEAGSIARAIRELLSEPGTMHEMGRAGRDLWAERYSSQRMTEAYVKIYKELMESGTPKK